MKCIVGFSGGIDSIFAAYLLKQQGNEIILVNFSVNGNFDENTKKTAEKLGLEIVFVDIAKDFKEKIIKYFVEYYKQGKTPNPCIWCNPLIKFWILEKIRLKRGFDKIATGHYANIIDINKKQYISKAEDLTKDQSYMLYRISEKKDGTRILDNTLFPVGKYKKSDIKNILGIEGFIGKNNQKESQDICFIPDNDYSAFILKDSDTKYPQGNILNLEGKIIGKHKGIIYYTVGQRSGLGINQKLYVLDVDAKSNSLIVGDEKDLYQNALECRDFFIHDEIVDNADFSEGKITGKIRYRHGGEQIKSIQKDGEKYKIIFENPVRAITRGQHLVLYKSIDGQNVVVGGGEIC